MWASCKQLLALVPRDIDGGIGKVHTKLAGAQCIQMSKYEPCSMPASALTWRAHSPGSQIAVDSDWRQLHACSTSHVGNALKHGKSHKSIFMARAYGPHVQVLAASSYAALLAQAWDALPADAQHAGDAKAASTLLHAAQDLCAYQAAVGEHYCCPIALHFSMLPCLLATQSGVCDPAAVVIHSSTLCEVCMPSAGSGKKTTWKSVGREACGPHWIGRLVAYLVTVRCALLCPDPASIAEVQHICGCMPVLCLQ